MTLLYDWIFPQLDAHPIHDDKENVVFTIHWRLHGVDENNNTANVYGTVGMSYNKDDPFVSFDQLTKEIVQGWVETSLGEEMIEAYKNNIANQIQEKITPSKVSLTPPWM